jgi:hypothetical protein
MAAKEFGKLDYFRNYFSLVSSTFSVVVLNAYYCCCKGLNVNDFSDDNVICFYGVYYTRLVYDLQNTGS